MHSPEAKPRTIVFSRRWHSQIAAVAPLRHSPRQISAGGTMSPRISYVQPSTVTDQEMLAEFDRCAREGTPRPESQAIRAHVPAVFWSFANSLARPCSSNGVADHAIKELCRVYVSRSVLCEFCGNQRSIKAAKAGTVEDDYMDLINFEASTRYDRQAEGRARLCGGDHLGSAADRRVLGAAAQALQRAGAGRDRIFRGAHHGPAALAAYAEYRAPPGSRRHRRVRWRRASRRWMR